jgi:antitoxin YefM
MPSAITPYSAPNIAHHIGTYPLKNNMFTLREFCFYAIMYYLLYIDTKQGNIMHALTYSYTRQHLADVMRQVNDDRSPVVVTTQRGKPVVIMALEDYEAMEETAYLARSPANAQRLNESITRIRAGISQERNLIDAD